MLYKASSIAKIRILQIGKYYYPYRGGFESSLYTLINELKNEFDFQVLAAHTRVKTVIEKTNNLTVIRLGSLGKIFSQPLTPALLPWLKRLSADIVHIHLPNPLAMFFYLIASPKGKLIVSYHNDIVRQGIMMPFLRPFLKKILNRANLIIVTSQNLLNSSEMLRAFRGKCRIIPHGIDLNRFRASLEVLAEADKIRRKINKPIILFVGRLVYYKGLEYLIQAMQEIDARLMIIGEGPLERKLKLQAKLRGVCTKIIWLRDISDDHLPIYYQACDVFVLPSCEKSESFGLVILEAQASGKPVVTTDLPTGVTFTNLHQRTGLVAAAKDSVSLASAINCLLASKQLRDSYGRRARKRVKRKFTKERMSREIADLYKALVRTL